MTHKKEEEIEYHGCCANFSNGDRRDVSHGFMVALSEAYTQDCAAELCAGRSLGVMAFAGKVRHNTIAATPPLEGERFIGWLCHYLIGIAFAAVPLVLSGADWFYAPTLATALLSGVVTLLAPFLILQPAFGFGVAASRTPRPWLARSLSLLAHLAYGIGLYLAASAYRVMAMSADL